ncbi:MAG: hypothetical protein OXH76_00665 [Boseongicola sp.]|nr:hypothetical protein [Boseongicola sp.]
MHITLMAGALYVISARQPGDGTNGHPRLKLVSKGRQLERHHGRQA